MRKIICDMCKKDITNKKNDEKIKAIFTNKDGTIRQDLCEECFKKIYEVIETNSQKELYQTLLEEADKKIKEQEKQIKELLNNN